MIVFSRQHLQLRENDNKFGFLLEFMSVPEECDSFGLGPSREFISRHPPDDRLRWAAVAVMGGHQQARTIVIGALGHRGR